ncbi:uncharacterized protein LOC129222150 isoform X2 [Uloborus diversus]|uniref:uncharacterized protein LOC129222150 isoform X2 n=1 Tax=Uloborus diversus TaxID=327109 RepID=UPI00240992F2|nr:uncharacterized protein LOC129222150 isoform X2 [Uloborus diversus]
MRATAIFCIALAIGCAAALPTREKRSPFDPFGFFNGNGAFTGAYAGGFPFGGGAFAGAGFPFYYRPIPIYIPSFEIPKPWYKGENVCTEVKEAELSSIPKEWFSDVSFGDWNQQSESCRGNNNKYVCIERKTSGEGTKMVATKYECCYGFERPSNSFSPGCVESVKGGTLLRVPLE